MFTVGEKTMFALLFSIRIRSLFTASLSYCHRWGVSLCPMGVRFIWRTLKCKKLHRWSKFHGSVLVNFFFRRCLHLRLLRWWWLSFLMLNGNAKEDRLRSRFFLAVTTVKHFKMSRKMSALTFCNDGHTFLMAETLYGSFMPFCVSVVRASFCTRGRWVL